MGRRRTDLHIHLYEIIVAIIAKAKETIREQFPG